MSSELKSLIEYVSKSLVDMPDHVEVNEIEGEQTTVIELNVDKSDLGKVIGKQGRCYKIQIQDFGEQKELIVHPVHLRRYAS